MATGRFSIGDRSGGGERGMGVYLERSADVKPLAAASLEFIFHAGSWFRLFTIWILSH